MSGEFKTVTGLASNSCDFDGDVNDALEEGFEILKTYVTYNKNEYEMQLTVFLYKPAPPALSPPIQGGF